MHSHNMLPEDLPLASSLDRCKGNAMPALDHKLTIQAALLATALRLGLPFASWLLLPEAESGTSGTASHANR